MYRRFSDKGQFPTEALNMVGDLGLTFSAITQPPST
jgi:hypothetical protein